MSESNFVIVVSQPLNEKVEVPLLKGYLRSCPSYPDFVPAWVPYAGWGTFAVLTIYLALIREWAIFGTIAAALIAGPLFLALKSFYKPRSDRERAEDLTYSALRKLKRAAGESNLNKRLPTPVLIALEGAVQAYNTSLARITAEDPALAHDAARGLKNLLHGCFFSGVAVLRDDEHSRKEWEAMRSNASLVNEVVDSIQLQTARMRAPLALDSERLCALRELDSAHESVTVTLDR